MKTKNIKRFWMLFRQIGHVDEHGEKEAMVLSFTNGRTESIREMTLAEFQMMLATLEGMVAANKKSTSADYAKLDKARKRVMAAIGAFLRSKNYKDTTQVIFGIALHACEGKYRQFNDIPLQKLNSLYAAFRSHVRVQQVVDVIDYIAERKRIIGLYQEAVDGEDYRLAAFYKNELELMENAKSEPQYAGKEMCHEA